MKTFLSSFIAIGLFFSANAHASEFETSFGATNYILIDAETASCKSRNSTKPVADVMGLYADLGKVIIKWTPKTIHSEFHPVFIKFYPMSNGLANNDPVIVAGEELNCLFGNIQQGPIFKANQPTVIAKDNLVLGNLIPSDVTKRTAFTGTSNYIVYGLMKTPGLQDEPVVIKGTFDFQFDGIF